LHSGCKEGKVLSQNQNIEQKQARIIHPEGLMERNDPVVPSKSVTLLLSQRQ